MKTNLFLLMLSFILYACAGESANFENPVNLGESYTTARVSYENILEDKQLCIKISNISFELLIKSELYVEFFNDEEKILGYNKRTFSLKPEEWEMLKFPVPDQVDRVKIHFDEYDARKPVFVNFLGTGDEYDYKNFGSYYITIQK